MTSRVGYGPVPRAEEDHSRVDVDDRFDALLNGAGEGAQPGDALIELAQRYSYVVPDAGSLSILADLGPLVEMGAGNGYWAHRLRALGVDVVAYDLAPPDGDRPNRYHPMPATWTDVIAGDQTNLAHHPDRALLLCWPPLFSSLGECLIQYSGDTVALIGDGGHRTARLQDLNETFTNVAAVPVRALDPFPGTVPTLSVWRRRASRQWLAPRCRAISGVDPTATDCGQADSEREDRQQDQRPVPADYGLQVGRRLMRAAHEAHELGDRHREDEHDRDRDEEGEQDPRQYPSHSTGESNTRRTR